MFQIMNTKINNYCNSLEKGVDKVRSLTKDFCKPLGITTFAFVRIYHDGRIGWVTSNADQDRFLVESRSIEEDPLVNTEKGLKEGPHLWFNDRQFPGSEAFYRERARLFSMDHGMVLVKHSKNYLETCCYSGLRSKGPLYNLFLNEIGIFNAFMEHFKKQLTCPLLQIIEEGLKLEDFKKDYGKPPEELKRAQLLEKCGLKNILKVTKREKECLLALRSGYTYKEIGDFLEISERTVEHYLNNIKDKLGLEKRSELFSLAEQLHRVKYF